MGSHNNGQDIGLDHPWITLAQQCLSEAEKNRPIFLNTKAKSKGLFANHGMFSLSGRGLLTAVMGLCIIPTHVPWSEEIARYSAIQLTG